MNFGVITDAWDKRSLRSAVAMATTLRSYHRWPVTLFLEKDAAFPKMRLDIFDDVRCVSSIRGRQKHINKFYHLRNSPYRTTLWLDNDLLFFGEIDFFVQHLKSEPFSMFVNYVSKENFKRQHSEGWRRGISVSTMLRLTYSITSGPGGHYLYERNPVGRRRLEEIIIAATDPFQLKLYRILQGERNDPVYFADEPWVMCHALLNGIRLPSFTEFPERDLYGCYMEDDSGTYRNLKLENGRLSYTHIISTWDGEQCFLRKVPKVIHFIGNGKKNGCYLSYVSHLVG